MTETIEIRRASAADGELLARLGARTFFDSFGEDNRPESMAAYMASAFSSEMLAAELVEQGSVFLIAEVEDAVAGYARLREGRSPEQVPGRRLVELARLYAQRGYIGKGVGSALMQACLDEARGRGCDSIWLGVWSENQRGIDFYRRWGFSEVGTQVFHLGDEAQSDLVMQRPI